MLLRKRSERIAGQLIWIGYYIWPVVGFTFAWWLRFQSGFFKVLDYQPFEKYYVPILIVATFWSIVYGALKLHTPALNLRWTRETSKMIWGAALAMIPTMALAFSYRGYFYSRLVMTLGIVFTFGLCFTHKVIAKSILKKMLLKRVGIARKLIIGCNSFAQKVVNEIRRDPLAAAGLVGMISVTGERCTTDLPYLGDISELREIIIKGQFDEAIFAYPNPSENMILKIIYECRKEQVQFELVPPFRHLLRGRVEVEPVGDVQVLAFTDLALKVWQRGVKRAADLLLSSILLILLSPLLITISVAIKLTSTGHIFFLQERIGRNGRKFQMIKFRSMYKDAEKRLKEHLEDNEAQGPIFKIKKDPRITSIGRLIRRFSIDEIPQLFNVLLGQMSLVGPRPPLEREVKVYENWQLRRIDVTPGMTGLWQVSGRSDLSFEKMVELDIHYIENWSLVMDIMILFKTLPAVITGKGAY